MKRWAKSLVLLLCAFFLPLYAVSADGNPVTETVADIYTEAEPWPEDAVATLADVSTIPAKSGILIDAESGRVLFESNADEPMPPASITKIMTLLLTFEAMEDGQFGYDDTITCSEHASSMGGTQIWLEPGEEMRVEDLIKATAINSANDAAMALAEFVAGSETEFVERMNSRAKELGMTNTVFINPTGLDADGHLSTARDIALMSKELLKHEDIIKFSTIWMDSLRGGETGLVNTNKLVRFYKGCIGLKTGTTDGAGSCLSAAAEREGLRLIAVSMGSATSDERFSSCRTMLDYGFSAFERYEPKLLSEELSPVKVLRGVGETVPLTFTLERQSLLIPKGRGSDVQKSITMQEDVEAPVLMGQAVGEAAFTLDGETLCEVPITAAEAVDRMTFANAFLRMISYLLGL